MFLTRRGAHVVLLVAVLISAQLGTTGGQHHHHHNHDHHDHDHHHVDHGHSDESPAFKYSRAANAEPRHSDAHGHHAQSHRPAPPSAQKGRTLEETAYLWARALGSTVLISIAPFVILFFIPIDSRSGHESLLKVLLSFASGGLLGDAFLHLIPHALAPHGDEGGHHAHADHAHGDHAHGGHAHGPHDMSVGLWVLAGILAFLMVEKFVRMIKGGHGHSHGHAHEHEHEHEHDAADVDEKPTGKCDGESSGGEDKSTTNNVVQRKKPAKKSECSDDARKSEPEKPDIKVAAYLNLAADFTHNFTDGLAIGASYIAGNTAGFISTITILLHEVPHEIGDFAILVQSGYSKRRAMCMQLVTALGCLSGTVCSLVAEGMSGSANSWVLPFTAGGFIYIATVSVIPELLENTRLWQSIKEVLALLLGVSMMALLTQFE